MLSGFVWLATEIIISRSLHWDGLCDVADAIGSLRTGDAFWDVMKDSRIGAFGAAALVTVFAGQLLGASAHVAAGNWAVLVLAPSWSRCQAAQIFFLLPPRNPKSLGGRFATDLTVRQRYLPLLQLTATALCLPALGISWINTAMACFVSLGILFWIVRTARRHGGLNGDFAGCAIELNQLGFLLACC